jgi:hypothetical protein
MIDQVMGKHSLAKEPLCLGLQISEHGVAVYTGSDEGAGLIPATPWGSVMKKLADGKQSRGATVIMVGENQPAACLSLPRHRIGTVGTRIGFPSRRMWGPV